MARSTARKLVRRALRCALPAAIALGLFAAPSAQAAVLFGSDLTLPPAPPPATPCNPAVITDVCTNVGIAYLAGNTLPATRS